MNNRDAWDYLSTKDSARGAAKAFMQEFQIEENEYEPIRHKFTNLKSARDSSRKVKKLEEWENNIFYFIPSAHPTKKRILEERIIVESDLSMETKRPLSHSQFPLTIKIADGFDGSGCHQIYNQYEFNPTFSTKNYILFAFKLLSIMDSDNSKVWINNIPNSQFGAQKESISNVKFIMERLSTQK